MSRISSPRFVPLILAAGIVVGILIGSFYANHYAGNRLSIINSSTNKLNDLLHIIDDQYVDTVNMQDLVEKSLPQILKELDPHSTYVSAKDVDASMQDLKGSFSGIGVQFTIFKDTTRVMKVLNGGPSEEIGLKPGDRIISVDGKPYIGKIVTNDETMKRLKGEKNSRVKLGIYRPGNPKTIYFTITRGDVPVNSISAAYMADKTTGYIKINSFAETTYSEFLAALAKLNHLGFKGLIIDLRGNLGGYLEPAVRMAMEFLPKDRLIVYTQGRKSPRQEYKSDGRGSYQSLPLVILVDEGSASASEIFSGAMQDNDRALIIGRRTFGKGLVQEPIQFADGSMLRLTIARYYTPSGRCVQKPYTPGDEKDYESDLLMRAEHGEFYSKDSIKTKGPAYKTHMGRIVYGGGGIIPDIFVPADTLGMTSYFKEAYMSGLLYQYACVYTDKNRAHLARFKDLASLLPQIAGEDFSELFAQYAANNGMSRRNNLIRQSSDLFQHYLTGYIVDNLLDTQSSTEYTNMDDPVMEKALQAFANKQTFPQKLAFAKSTPWFGLHLYSSVLASLPFFRNFYYAIETPTTRYYKRTEKVFF